MGPWTQADMNLMTHNNIIKLFKVNSVLCNWVYIKAELFYSVSVGLSYKKNLEPELKIHKCDVLRGLVIPICDGELPR